MEVNSFDLEKINSNKSVIFMQVVLSEAVFLVKKPGGDQPDDD